MDHGYPEEIRQVWREVLEEFRKTLSDVAIDLWFGTAEIRSFRDSVLTMTTESDFKYEIIQTKYLATIEKEFSERLGFDITVDLQMDPDRAHKGAQQEVPETQPVSPPKQTPPEENAEKKKADSQVKSWGSTMPEYNFEYTFDNFIVGNSNRFAHAACTAVAANPAMNYNPLFIYGPSGIGKTHLLYAITNEIKSKKPDVKIIYIKGEDFTNQFIDALAHQMITEFRNKYRSCDMILIDDIQFIAGKVSTQEEFFHTFNALFEDHKQIILTSDLPPRDMKTLEDRLKTRFEWGLLADIQPPDLELRIAITKKKAEQVGITLTDDILTFIAENAVSNIRQIEGVIKKLGAVSLLNNDRQITLADAQDCIQAIRPTEKSLSVIIDKIFASVYAKYGIKREELVGKKRTKEIALPRHTAIYMIRTITDMSLPNIGKIFNRDHTTVMSSLDTVEKLLKNDQKYRMDTDAMLKEISDDIYH